MSCILILSSDSAFREKNTEVLRQAGLEVTVAADCLQGLPLLNKDKFDIVVIDNELSDMSGSQGCRIIRQQTGVSIILLGTIAEPEAWAKAGELGFDLYLKKKVSPKELLTRVQALLRHPSVERKPLISSLASALPDMKKPAMLLPSNTPPQISPRRPLNLISRIFGNPRLSESISAKPLPTASAANRDKQLQRRPQQLPSGGQVSQGKSQVAPEIAKPVPTPPAPKDTHGTPGDLSPQSPQSQPMPVVQSDEEISSPFHRVSPTAGPGPTIRAFRETGQKAPPPSRGPEFVPQKPARETTSQEQSVASAGEVAAIFEDLRALKLVDAMVNGKLNDITPTIDFNLKAGYSYPAVEGLIDTSEQVTINVLNALAEADVLIRQQYEKFYVDPEGLFQLVPVEHCPRDDSSNLIKGQLVEHFACGYVGLDRDFRQDSRYVCPKCRKDMRLIGTDYRNIGIHYRCQDDGEIFTTPVIKWRNVKTRKEWTVEELKEVDVYSYRFNPDKRSWLEFQLKPKAQLVEFLRARGYEVQEYAQLTGRSGAVHTFDVLAVRNDILTRINLGIGILAAAPGETEVSLEALFRFDTRAYDIGLNYKVVIAIPKLGPEAISFANRQMISAFEAKTLASVVSDITGMKPPYMVPQSGVKTGDQEGPEAVSEVGAARSLILKFLRNRGYEVYEGALITGKSGIEHVLDIFAQRDDKIIVPTIAIGVVGSAGGQPVGMDEIAMFDAAAFDSGIRNKVFLGLPEIGVQAKQYARQQRIDVIEQKDLDKLV